MCTSWAAPRASRRGGQLRVYPGCDLLDETCAGKFDNILNFRGFNKMQGKSPFDGDQVW
ncbi:phage BR0599 family protein [Pseudomonas aeruginosa]|nr:phage BR0599 family protein [Pseudomonas aeruginosa]WCI86485.1 phage BR0599 family protein [Pseudomonas aeruginosa]